MKVYLWVFLKLDFSKEIAADDSVILIDELLYCHLYFLVFSIHFTCSLSLYVFCGNFHT